MRLIQQELAEMTGMLREKINRIENDRYSHSLDVLIRIVDAINCDLDLNEKSPY